MKRKVLLMGRSASGKTSMRSIIFANYLARDAKRLGPTIDMEQSQVKLFGNLVLNLWDCGGQEQFMENYLLHQKDHIFSGVAVLIYVFDVESRTMESDLNKFRSCVESLATFSPDALLFCLIHKMDLISECQRQDVFASREHQITNLLQEGLHGKCATCFATSIWDESLYHAWSSIVHAMIPNIHILDRILDHVRHLCHAQEVVLFERATFLIISQRSVASASDVRRFERISNIMKLFKLSCTRAGTAFTRVTYSSLSFSAFIEKFTENTYALFIVSNPSIPSASTIWNMQSAKELFQKALDQPQSFGASPPAGNASAQNVSRISGLL